MTLPSPTALLAYNPELIAKEDLIRGFVAHQPLLERLLDAIRRETAHGAPQHHLIIGPRGTGKTTLLRRFAFAVEDDNRLSHRWQPVTFPEEQYNVTNLTSFWLNCINALGDALDRDGDLTIADALDKALENLPADPALRRVAALKLLTDTSTKVKKRLLLLVDNVDLIFERIGKDQEWEFRQALSAQSRLLLVGASSRALEHTYEYDRAFYDFFQIHELAGLTDAETLVVFKALVQRYQATEVERLLEENPGRIQAMRLLTGGNPRAIVLLFKILARRPQGDIETDLQQLLDEYTPLYKARFEDLAQQAQILVDAIAVHWDPITAGDLAELVDIPVNTVSAQLQRLDSLGFIEKTPWYGEKKNAFQITERFFNAWYLMRGTRRVRRRLSLLVKFLEIWFNETERRTRVPVRPALEHALVTSDVWDEARPRIEQWARAESPSLEDIESFGVVVAAGRTKDVLDTLKKEGAEERMRPLYEALRAVDAGSVDYLRRVAPEIRVPARELLARIAPQMITDPAQSNKREPN